MSWNVNVIRIKNIYPPHTKKYLIQISLNLISITILDIHVYERAFLIYIYFLKHGFWRTN